MSKSIDYIGIDNNLPTNIKYFKEEIFGITVQKSKSNVDIHKIISVSIDCKINSIKLVNTQVRTSNEGQKLTGKKLLVELNFIYRIKYISTSKEKYLYILKENATKVIYVVLPQYIDDTRIEDIIRKKKVKIDTYIEDLYAECRSYEQVYLRTLVLVNASIKT